MITVELKLMNRRARYHELMQQIDAIILSAGVRSISLNSEDFDLVAEFMKHDDKIHPDAIHYNGRLLKKVNVRKK